MDYLVNADHVAERYRLVDATVTVSHDGERFYVNLSPFGCSKSYATPTTAIHMLLLDNGCTNIRVHRAA